MNKKHILHSCFAEKFCITEAYLEPFEKRTQVTFTCSNSIIETLEKGVKYVQS